jgi:hypothetical protein
MKLTHTRIATKDVPRLVQFYQKVTEISPSEMTTTSSSDPQWVSSPSVVSELWICTTPVRLLRRPIDRQSSNSRSMMWIERGRVSKESNLSWNQLRNHGETGRCCSAIPTATSSTSLHRSASGVRTSADPRFCNWQSGNHTPSSDRNFFL